MPTRLRRTRMEWEAVPRQGNLAQQAERFRRLLADRVKAAKMKHGGAARRR